MKTILQYSTLLVLFIFASSCSIAQGGSYGTKDKKAIKLYEAGRVCYNARDPKCAQEKFEAALKRDPNFAEALMLLSDVYIDLKDFENAIKIKERFIALGKRVNSSDYFYIAAMYMEVGDYENALKHSSSYLQFRDTNPNMYAKCKKFIIDSEFAIEAKKNPVDYEPKNLGKEVNSDRHEYFPSITADDSTLLYTRLVQDELPTGKMFDQEDIFIARKSPENHWSYGMPISDNVNTLYNEGAPTFSADGKYVIMVGCETGQRGEKQYGKGRSGLGSCDLFVSERIGDNWTKPVNMGSGINSGHWETQPSFSSDGKTLYFIRGKVNYREGRKSSEQDIYYTEIGPDGQWTTPKPVPGNINTPGREESVQIHPDGQTLYFSSDGHPGMGKLDIYMSRKQPDGTWGDPINLGYPINSHHDENSLLVSSNGKLAFFASDNRDDSFGGLDLYSFELPEKFQPIRTTFVKGLVYDIDTKEPLAAKFELTDINTSTLVKSAIANSGDGSFLVALPTNASFALHAEHANYQLYSKNYSFEKLRKTEEGFVIDVPMKKIDKNTEFTLENVFFDVAKWDLKNESLAELNKLKDYLETNNKLSVELGGHTDSDGDDKANQILSENRAKAVHDWLITNGISKERLSYKGYGESQPAFPNDTAENKAKNRRTMLKITGIN